MPAADRTPEREEQLTADLLRERAGIDPGSTELLTDLAAIGLVNGAWRNTCVENWHAEGRMRDGDMLLVNSHTTWRVRCQGTLGSARWRSRKVPAGGHQIWLFREFCGR